MNTKDTMIEKRYVYFLNKRMSGESRRKKQINLNNIKYLILNNGGECNKV